MSVEIESSVAFAALSRPGRKVYSLLVGKIESRRTGNVAITSAEMMASLSISSSSSVASSVRELKALGLITVDRGERGIGTYSLADAWRGVTELEEAKRSASAARLPPKRKPLARPQGPDPEARRRGAARRGRGRGGPGTEGAEDYLARTPLADESERRALNS